MINTIFLAVFVLLSLLILISAALSPIARRVGFRNVQRRIGNTVLVILGSLVGTALISGSLILSDSLDRTFLHLVEQQTGEVDVIISVNNTPKNEIPIAFGTTSSKVQLENIFKNDDKIDGLFIRSDYIVAPAKLDAQGNPVLNTYQSYLTGIKVEDFNKFGQEPFKIVNFEKENSAIISQIMANSLELSKGDKVLISYANANIVVEVQEIYEDTGMIGGKTMLVDNTFLNEQLGFPADAFNTVIVSAKGGIKPDNYDAQEFQDHVDEKLKEFKSDDIYLVTTELKQQALDGYGLKFFTQMFLVLSMFGILAGILLIVNLYLMLAGERKSEMGILRAIAFTRLQLTRTFIYEGYIYSIVSSLIGTLIGLGIGYALVYSLANMFQSLFDSFGDAGFSFEILFDANLDSLIIAFTAGALITIITSIGASYKISKLNIVSAIRETEDVTEKKISARWFISTLLILLVDLFYAGVFVFSFVLKEVMQQSRDQGGTDNPLAEMSQKKFDETIMTTRSFMLYFGVTFTVFFTVILLNRIFKALFKKDISRFTLTLASIISIIFNLLMIKIDYVFKTIDQSTYGFIIFFLSGIVLVIAATLIVSENLGIILRFLNVLLSPLGKLRSVVLVAFRYPAANKSRTGLTLIMFSLIIFLIAFASILKSTNAMLTEDIMNKAIGGYDLIIIPDKSVTLNQANNIEAKAENVNGVTGINSINHLSVIIPAYKYRDLPDTPYFGNPFDNIYRDEDFFTTTIDAIPNDFIDNTNIALSERLENYETDKAVWETIKNDDSKIVLGSSYGTQGYGKRPALKLGDKIVIADKANNVTKELEIIALVDPLTGSTGFNIYPNLITSENFDNSDFDASYVQNNTTKEILISVDRNNSDEVTKNIKKALIKDNISFVFELDDVTASTTGFTNSLFGLIQGFLAFSLIVGASGLAIIITRSVQERRQQIGMLRSLGFQRWMILLSFFIESTFITLMGIIIGVSMGTLGAYNIFNASFKDQPELSVSIPVTEIFILCLLIYIASIIFSALPSFKAATLSPVEATSYPE